MIYETYETYELHSAALAVLKKAWSKIEDPENWCQQYSATDSQGEFVSPFCDQAKKFCMVGAVYSAMGMMVNQQDRELKSFIFNLLFNTAENLFSPCSVLSLAQINDSMGYDAVRKIFLNLLRRDNV